MLPYRRPEDLPEKIPLFPLPRALLLPRAQLPLTIFEPRFLKMADDAMASSRLIGMIQPRQADEGAARGLYPIGCAGRITSFSEIADDRLMLVLTGVCRFRLRQDDGGSADYRIGHIGCDEFAADMETRPPGAKPIPRQALLDVLRRYLKQNRLGADWKAIERTPDEMLVNSLSVLSPFGVPEKQALLEAPSIAERCRTLIALTEIALAGDGKETVQ